jgi:hypothetical protein
MNKREFLAATAGIAALPTVEAASPVVRGPSLLTVVGNISRTNRGALDPAFDQMMKKQGMKFEKAYAFDFTALSLLHAVTIKPTLEYDKKPHTLSGPLLADVLAATGATVDDKTKLVLRAVDGYAVIVSVADARKYRTIIATQLDGKPLPLGGLGPLWAVYDADSFADMAAKPISDRFAQCPWGLYSVEVQG